MSEFLRSLRIGARWLRLQRAYDFGLKVELTTLVAKRRYLERVVSLSPMASESGPVECFMLLDEARIWEGIWSLYSFRMNIGPCRLVILNDGSLTSESLRMLREVFPGIVIPDFADNNAETAADLTRLGLQRCVQWRERFVFFRKLIDPFRLTISGSIVLLDSDCLHFRCPEEVRVWAAKPARVRFISDAQAHSFCAEPDKLARICGTPLPDFFCAGYLCVPKATVNFARVERYLSDECFERQLVTGRFSHVAEQTLYAMEAALTGADALSAEYATCPDVPKQDVTAGHYCGGAYSRTWFYTKGLPLVSQRAQAEGNRQDSAVKRREV